MQQQNKEVGEQQELLDTIIKSSDVTKDDNVKQNIEDEINAVLELHKKSTNQSSSSNGNGTESSKNKTANGVKEISIIEAIMYIDLITPYLQTCILHLGWRLHPMSVQILPLRISSDPVLYKAQMVRLAEHENQNGAEEYKLYTQEEALKKFGGEKDSEREKLCKLLFKLLDLTDRIDFTCVGILGRGSMEGIDTGDNASEFIKKKKQQLREIVDNDKILELIKEERHLNVKNTNESANYFIQNVEEVAICILGLHLCLFENVTSIYLESASLATNPRNIFCDETILTSTPLEQIITDTADILTVTATVAKRTPFKKNCQTVYEWALLHTILLEVVLPLIHSVNSRKILDKALRGPTCKSFLEIALLDQTKRKHATFNLEFVMNGLAGRVRPLLIKCINLDGYAKLKIPELGVEKTTPVLTKNDSIPDGSIMTADDNTTSTLPQPGGDNRKNKLLEAIKSELGPTISAEIPPPRRLEEPPVTNNESNSSKKGKEKIMNNNSTSKFFRNLTKDGLQNQYNNAITVLGYANNSTSIEINLKKLSDSIAEYASNRNRNGDNGKIGLTDSNRVDKNLFKSNILSSKYAVTILEHFKDIWNDDLEPIFITIFKQNLFAQLIDSINKLYNDGKLSSDSKRIRYPVIYNESAFTLIDSNINNTFWKIYTEGWPSYLARNISEAHAISCQTVMEVFLYYAQAIPNVVVTRASNYREQQFKRSEYRNIFLSLLPILIKYNGSTIDKQLPSEFVSAYPIDDHLIDLYHGCNILQQEDETKEWKHILDRIKKSVSKKIESDSNERLKDVSLFANMPEFINMYSTLHEGYRYMRQRKSWKTEEEEGQGEVHTEVWPRTIEQLDRLSNSIFLDAFSGISTVLLTCDGHRNFMEDIRNDVESASIDMDYEGSDADEEGGIDNEAMDVDNTSIANNSTDAEEINAEDLVLEQEQEREMNAQKSYLQSGFDVNVLRNNLISDSKQKLYMLSNHLQSIIIPSNTEDVRVSDISSLQDLVKKKPGWINRLRINKLKADELFVVLNLKDIYSAWNELYDKVRELYREQIVKSYDTEGESVTDQSTQDMINRTLETSMKMRHSNDDIITIFLTQELDPTSVQPSIVRSALNNKLDISEMIRQVNPDLISFINLKSIPGLTHDQQLNMQLNPLRLQLFISMIKYILAQYNDNHNQDSAVDIIKMISQSGNLIDNSPLLNRLIKYAATNDANEASSILLNWNMQNKDNGLTLDSTIAICEVSRSLLTYIVYNTPVRSWLMELHTFDAYISSGVDMKRDNVINFWKEFKLITNVNDANNEKEFITQWDYAYDIMHASDLSVATFLSMKPDIVIDKFLFKGANKQFGQFLNHAAFRLNLYTNPAFLVYLVKIPRNVRGAFLSDCVNKILQEPLESGEGNTTITILQQSKIDIVIEFSRLFYVLDIHYSTNNTCLEDLTSSGLVDPENGLYTPEIQKILSFPLTTGEKYIRDIITNHINNSNADISFMMMNVALQNRFKSIWRSQQWMTTALNRQHRNLSNMSKSGSVLSGMKNNNSIKFIGPATTYFKSTATKSTNIIDESYQMDLINNMQYILLAIWSVTDPLVPIAIDINLKKPHDASLMFIWNADSNTQMVARSNEVPMTILDNGMEIPTDCLEHNDIRVRMFYLCYTGTFDALKDSSVSDTHLQTYNSSKSGEIIRDATEYKAKLPDSNITYAHQSRANLTQFILYGSNFDLCRSLISLFTAFIELSDNGNHSANLSIAWPLIDQELFLQEQHKYLTQSTNHQDTLIQLNILKNNIRGADTAIGFKSDQVSKNTNLLFDYYQTNPEQTNVSFFEKMNGSNQVQFDYSDLFLMGLKTKNTPDELLSPTDEIFNPNKFSRQIETLSLQYAILHMSSLEPSSYDVFVLDKDYRNSREWLTNVRYRSENILKQRYSDEETTSIINIPRDQELFGKPRYSLTTPFYTWHKYAHNEVQYLKLQRLKLISTIKSATIKSDKDEEKSIKDITNAIKKCISAHQEYYQSFKPHWVDSKMNPWMITKGIKAGELSEYDKNDRIFGNSKFNRDIISANVSQDEKRLALRSFIFALELNLRYLALRDINKETVNSKYRNMIPVCVMSILRILWRLYSPSVAMAVFSRCVEINPPLPSNTPFQNLNIVDFFYALTQSGLHSEAERVFKFYGDTKNTKYPQQRIVLDQYLRTVNISIVDENDALKSKSLDQEQFEFIEKKCNEYNILYDAKIFNKIHQRSGDNTGTAEEFKVRSCLSKLNAMIEDANILQVHKSELIKTRDRFQALIDGLLGSFLTNLQDYPLKSSISEDENEESEAVNTIPSDVTIEIRGRYKKAKMKEKEFAPLGREEKMLDNISIAIKNITAPVELYIKLDSVLTTLQKPVKEVILKLKPILQEAILLLSILQKQ